MLSIFSPLCIKRSQPAICTIVLCVYDEPCIVKTQISSLTLDELAMKARENICNFECNKAVKSMTDVNPNGIQ